MSNIFLSAAARTIVQANPFLTYKLHVAVIYLVANKKDNIPVIKIYSDRNAADMTFCLTITDTGLNRLSTNPITKSVLQSDHWR